MGYFFLFCFPSYFSVDHIIYCTKQMCKAVSLVCVLMCLGLCGVYDGDSSNDLTSKFGTVFTLVEGRDPADFFGTWRFVFVSFSDYRLVCVYIVTHTLSFVLSVRCCAWSLLDFGKRCWLWLLFLNNLMALCCSCYTSVIRFCVKCAHRPI